MYMMHAAQENTLQISGEKLSADSMKIKVRGDGQWSVMPCLFDEPVTITKALSDYYDRASAGDMIKSHDQFAYFSEDKKWEGNLTTMRPGEGYLFRRLKPGTVEITFYRQTTSNNIKRRQTMSNGEAGLFTNPQAATNMTMIAKLDNGQWTMDNGQLKVYVGDELACVATPVTGNPSPVTENLYFLTIQSDKLGELRFELNGETYIPVSGPISYSADSHLGSLKDPVLLMTNDELPTTYKILEDDHVVIIRNGERYDVTGKKL